MEEGEKNMIGVALVVGINNYEKATKLDNAVFDANSMADSLERLSFYTLRYNDINIDMFDDAISKFVEQLNKYDVGIFYFAGHGVEIGGENYLLSQNTPSEEEGSVKRYSMKLQEIVDKMNKTSCKTKILIIDACRNNPYAVGRGFLTTNLAPIFAPQGTIIAYSTSPGETALDGGIGKNSIYTGALLEHINELGLPIETFFKKVRTSVYNLSEGRQTSWEHTSLIGNFSFNRGQMIHSLNIPYSKDVVADKDYDIYSNPNITNIIEGFKSHDYYKQNDSLIQFEKINPSELNRNQLFVIGRNILQSAVGSSRECHYFINSQHRISKYTIDGNNHLLNGIFFELYFNKEGKLRERVKSSQYLSIILEYHSNPALHSSFEFINKILIPFEQRFIQIPSKQMNSVSLDIKMVKEPFKYSVVEEESEYYVIQSIKKDTKELLVDDYDRIINPREFSSIDELRNRLSEVLDFPMKYIKIISNIPYPDLHILLKKSISLYNN